MYYIFMLKKTLVLLLVLILCPCFSLFASSDSEPEVLIRLFFEGPSGVSYTKQFQAAVPLSVMQQVLLQINEQLGAFVSVEGSANPYSVIFEHGRATTYISLDGRGNIASLQFTQLIPAHGTLSEAVKSLVEMETAVSVLVRKNGEVLISHQEDIPLAVGSAFKLGILAAIEDAICANDMYWGQIVTLEDSWKSLPSGILQTWPAGSLITIETLATLMISLSDNTATDVLLSIVGREKVDQYLVHSVPTLSTGEMFRLKNPKNNDLLQRFRVANLDEKVAVLKDLRDRSLPEPVLFTGDPLAIDVEWYMTAKELADLIERLQALDLMTINPGLATKEHWRRVAYKGGSEPGVLNLTTFLLDDEENRFTVVVTVNNAEKALDEQRIMEIYQAILNFL
ncbi:MAG: serine hydrolase [Spirochaetia bacterium]|nr:serine hydrolase [Spirochaetia bacterium]